MSTVNLPPKYNLSRAEASKMLGVSIRTVDRYVYRQQLSSRHIEGRVWLNKEDVLAFNKGKKRIGYTGGHVDTSVSTPVNSYRDNVDTDVDSVDIVDVDILSTPFTNKNSDFAPTPYEKLYYSTKKELEQKQERLEIANYRVGQLEAQIKNSISLLQYHQQNNEEYQQLKALQARIDGEHDKIITLKKQINYEKFNKRIFATILLFLLALQPIWLLLIYK